MKKAKGKRQKEKGKSMKEICFCILLVFSFINIDVSGQGACVVDSTELIRHVYYLASDSLAGRSTGSQGQRLAAEYIAGEFEVAGLTPLGDSGYFQRFSVYRSSREFIRFRGDFRNVNALSIITDHHQIPDSCRIFFPGRRIRNLDSLPQENDYFMIINASTLRQARNGIEKLHNAGARNIILLSEKYRFKFLMWELDLKAQMNRISRQPDSKKLRRLTGSTDSIAVSLFTNNDIRSLTGEPADPTTWNKVARKRNSPVQIGGYYSCEPLFGTLDSTITENVVALLEGSEHPEQFVIITAHYDHIGKNNSGIYYGADDNASGTAALIEIARVLSCMKAEGKSFRHSVIFAAFSAEEIGLLGSAYFVAAPGFDTSNAIVNINMDMIGRSTRYSLIQALTGQMSDNPKEKMKKDSYVFLMNSGKGTRRHVRYSKKAARQYGGFMIDRNPGLLHRITYKYSSDHASFARAGVPILVYFTGLHPDYHTPRDTPDKIDYENMTRITEIILQTTRSIISK